MYILPNFSAELDNTHDTFSLSQSPTTPLHNRLLSASDISHGSRNVAGTLGGSLSYESGTYSGNLQNRCQCLKCELTYEKEEHKKLRKVSHFLVSQSNN